MMFTLRSMDYLSTATFLGEVMREEELITLYTHFKNNHPVLTPENKVIFCHSVWSLYLQILIIHEKHFEYKPMTQVE